MHPRAQLRHAPTPDPDAADMRTGTTKPSRPAPPFLSCGARGHRLPADSQDNVFFCSIP